MRYCINPYCKIRENQDDENRCKTCNTGLLIQGRYEIIHKISSRPNHPWEVFRVRDIQSSQDYILKTLTDNNPDNQRRFDAEKTALRKLNNSNIPEHIGDLPIPVGSNRLQLDCLVMEWIDGQDLLKWIDTNQRLQSENREEAIKWLRKIANTLGYIHSENLVHLDIKPSNIILRTNGNLALIDFGIARVVSAGEGAQTTSMSKSYAAPEQVHPNDPRGYPESDFFALGKTFIHLLTGNLPNSGSIARSNWEHNTELQETGIIPLIDWLIQERRDLRPQTTGQILKVLNYIDKPNGSHPDDADTERFINTIRNNQKPIERWISIAVLSVLLGAIIAGVSICRSNGGCGANNSKPTPSPTVTASSPPPVEESKAMELISFGDRRIDEKDTEKGDKVIPTGNDLIKINKGIDFFKQGNYLDAYTEFYNLHQNSPSARKYANLLIYMNNARVRYWYKEKNNPNKKTIETIVAAVPAYSNRGQQILWGVAHAQTIATLPAGSGRTGESPIKMFGGSSNLDKINLAKDLKEPKEYLEIGIANDLSDPATAASLSQELGKDSIRGSDGQQREVLGMVGHYSSEVSCSALPHYNNAGLPIVSPASTLRSLGSIKSKCHGTDKNKKSMFIRTASSSQKEAEGFMQYLDREENKKFKKILFYKQDKQQGEKADTTEFSQDLYNSLIGEKIHLESEFNLSNLTDVKNEIKKINEGSEQKIVILLPDAKGHEDSTYGSAIEVLKKLDPSKVKAVIVSNPLVTDLDDKSNKDADSLMKKWKGKLIGAVDWHGSLSEGASGCANEIFIKEANALWGGDVNRMTAQSYEAVQFLSHIFRKYRTREQVSEHLKSESVDKSDVFKTSKSIRSKKTGDGEDNGNREDITQRMLLKSDPDGKKRFIPIDKNQCH